MDLPGICYNARFNKPQQTLIICFVIKICTYENWPKSSKCAMCGTQNNQRSQASSLILPPAPERIEDINQDDRYQCAISGNFLRH